jgi:hypothetical protein
MRKSKLEQYWYLVNTLPSKSQVAKLIKVSDVSQIIRDWLQTISFTRILLA